MNQTNTRTEQEPAIKTNGCGKYMRIIEFKQPIFELMAKFPPRRATTM
jgi:hypothetical protein